MSCRTRSIAAAMGTILDESAAVRDGTGTPRCVNESTIRTPLPQIAPQHMLHRQHRPLLRVLGQNGGGEVGGWHRPIDFLNDLLLPARADRPPDHGEVTGQVWRCFHDQLVKTLCPRDHDHRVPEPPLLHQPTDLITRRFFHELRDIPNGFSARDSQWRTGVEPPVFGFGIRWIDGEQNHPLAGAQREPPHCLGDCLHEPPARL